MANKRMSRGEMRQWLNTIALWLLTLSLLSLAWAQIQLFGMLLNTVMVLLVVVSYLLGALSVLWLLHSRVFMTRAGIRRAWRAMMDADYQETEGFNSPSSSNVSEMPSDSEQYLGGRTVAFFPRRPIAPEQPVYRIVRNVGSSPNRYFQNCREDGGEYVVSFSTEGEAVVFEGYWEAVKAAAYCHIHDSMELDFTVVESDRALLAERSGQTS